MAVNEGPTDYTATASNTPLGTDTVGPDLDDHLRSIKGNVDAVNTHSDSTHKRGRFWFDQSASPNVTLNYSDGGQNIPIFEIDEDTASAGVTPYVGSVKMGAVGKNLAGAESTSSAADQLGLDHVGESTGSAITALKIAQLGEDSTASGHTKLALPESISGFIPSPSAQEYVIEQYAGYSYDITNLYAQTTTGNASVTLLVDGATAFAAVSATTTEVTGSATANGSRVTLGATLDLEVQTASSASNLSFSITGKRV